MSREDYQQLTIGERVEVIKALKELQPRYK